MGFFDKIFRKKVESEIANPEVPEGMKGVLMKGLGMHWTSCKPLVEEALQEVDGVKEIKVESPPLDQAFVIYDHSKTNVNKIKSAIQDSGYNVISIEELS